MFKINNRIHRMRVDIFILFAIIEISGCACGDLPKPKGHAPIPAASSEITISNIMKKCDEVYRRAKIFTIKGIRIVPFFVAHGKKNIIEHVCITVRWPDNIYISELISSKLAAAMGFPTKNYITLKKGWMKYHVISKLFPIFTQGKYQGTIYNLIPFGNLSTIAKKNHLALQMLPSVSIRGQNCYVIKSSYHHPAKLKEFEGKKWYISKQNYHLERIDDRIRIGQVQYLRKFTVDSFVPHDDYH